MRLGTLGDDGSCPTGYSLDSSGQLCLPAGSIDEGVPNYAAEATAALDPLPPLQGAGPLAPGQVYGTPIISASTLLGQGPLAPGQSYVTPGATGCPSGYANQGGVCVPAAAASLISGIPNWMLGLGAGFFLLLTMGSSMNGGRR